MGAFIIIGVVGIGLYLFAQQKQREPETEHHFAERHGLHPPTHHIEQGQNMSSSHKKFTRPENHAHSKGMHFSFSNPPQFHFQLSQKQLQDAHHITGIPQRKHEKLVITKKSLPNLVPPHAQTAKVDIRHTENHAVTKHAKIPVTRFSLSGDRIHDWHLDQVLAHHVSTQSF